MVGRRLTSPFCKGPSWGQILKEPVPRPAGEQPWSYEVGVHLKTAGARRP